MLFSFEKIDVQFCLQDIMLNYFGTTIRDEIK